HHPAHVRDAHGVEEIGKDGVFPLSVADALQDVVAARRREIVVEDLIADDLAILGRGFPGLDERELLRLGFSRGRRLGCRCSLRTGSIYILCLFYIMMLVVTVVIMVNMIARAARVIGRAMHAG